MVFATSTVTFLTLCYTFTMIRKVVTTSFSKTHLDPLQKACPSKNSDSQLWCRISSFLCLMSPNDNFQFQDVPRNLSIKLVLTDYLLSLCSCEMFLHLTDMLCDCFIATSLHVSANKIFITHPNTYSPIQHQQK